MGKPLKHVVFSNNSCGLPDRGSTRHLKNLVVDISFCVCNRNSCLRHFLGKQVDKSLVILSFDGNAFLLIVRRISEETDSEASTSLPVLFRWASSFILCAWAMVAINYYKHNIITASNMLRVHCAYLGVCGMLRPREFVQKSTPINDILQSFR